MARLIPLSELTRDRNYDLGEGYYDPTGETAYGADGDKLGRVEGALTEEGGKIRYLIVDVGNWFSSKRVLLPVGMARFEDDAVYFDNLTRDQAKAMNEYVEGQDYDYDRQVSDERVLRGANYTGDLGYARDTATTGANNTENVVADRRYNYRDDVAEDRMFRTPQKLQLLEERLLVNKERYHAGSVEVGKRVETRQENVNVDLKRDEVVIERHPVSEMRPVEGNVTLGAASETVRVDLEAERANVQKQAYVAEEVTVGKRSTTEQQTFTDTVGKEVLDVNKTGDVEVQGGSDRLSDTKLSDNDRDLRNR